MRPQQNGLDALAARAAFSDQGQTSETLDKSEILLLLVQNLFLRVQVLDDIPEPVVVRQNNKFNIFPMIRQSLIDDYRVNADKFWGIVKKAHSNDDDLKEIWRPRFQGYQLKCLGTVRYPHSEEEWDRLHVALAAIGPALVPHATPEGLVMQMKSFVDEFGNLWRSERRYRYKRQREVNIGAVADERLPDGEFQSVPTSGHARRVIPEAEPVVEKATVHRNGEDERFVEPEQWLSQSGDPSHADSQTLDKGKVIATLVVGGKKFTTTLETLFSVTGSFFYDLVNFSAGASEFFVDRSPVVFDYIHDYMRATRYAEPIEHFPLPRSIHELKLLLRESKFYKMPELILLVEHALESRKSPIVDICILETPSVPSEQALHAEVQTLSKKATSWMKAKTDSLGISSDTLEITSHDVRVIENGPGKKACVALTMQHHAL